VVPKSFIARHATGLINNPSHLRRCLRSSWRELMS